MSQKPTKQVAKRKATKQRRVECREAVELTWNGHWCWWPDDYDDMAYYYEAEATEYVDLKDSGWSLKRPYWMARLDALTYLPTAWEHILESPL